MKFIIAFILMLFFSCNNDNGILNRYQKTHDSITAFTQTSIRDKKYSDSLYKAKYDVFLKMKENIPFSEQYYIWDDFKNVKSHQIRISETTIPDLRLSDEANSTEYEKSPQTYCIFDVIDNKNFVLFKTVSEKQKDSVLWKFQYINKNKNIGNWSTKKLKDKEFTSLGNYIPDIVIAKAQAIKDSITYLNQKIKEK